MDSAMEQIQLALEDPETVFGSKEEQLVTITMPMKKQKTTKQQKKKKKEEENKNTTEIQISITQSIALLKAIINDSIHQYKLYRLILFPLNNK